MNKKNVISPGKAARGTGTGTTDINERDRREEYDCSTRMIDRSDYLADKLIVESSPEHSQSDICSPHLKSKKMGESTSIQLPDNNELDVENDPEIN